MMFKYRVVRRIALLVVLAAAFLFGMGDLSLSADDSGRGTTGKVLRHAVFFSFKDSSTEDEIDEVCQALVSLKDKIDTIVDVKWGTTTPRSAPTADGFSHCFLITFADEAGRATYLPHPAHSQEFVGVLRPHMKDVFVVDYWANPTKEDLESPLRHMAFLQFKDDAPQSEIDAVLDAFDALPEIGLVKGYEWGRNNSPETHDDGFTHCYMITFESDEVLDQYNPHPTHQALAKLLPPVMEKLRVIDFVER